MKTVLITGTDVQGPTEQWDASWIERPSRPLDRSDEASVRDMWAQISIGRPDSVALVMRGIHDQGFQYMPMWREVYLEQPRPFALTPFIETGALRDVVSWGNDPVDFDFGNDEHLRRCRDEMFLPFFDAFEGVPILQTTNDRDLVLFWSIAPVLGIVNQHSAGRLLNVLAEGLEARGRGRPDCVVHDTWPNVPTYGRHAWFDPNTRAFTITDAWGVRTGITVPGFHDPVGSSMNRVLPRIDNFGRNIFEHALATFRHTQVDVAFIESWSNVIESTGLYFSQSWSPESLYVDLLRAHMDITNPPTTTEDAMPIAEPMISRTQLIPIASRPGYYTARYPKDAGTVLSIQPNGEWATRPLGTEGPWEICRIEGTRLVFPETDAVTRGIPLGD